MDQIGQILIQALSLGSFYALIALGFALILGVAHVFNLAHGSFIMLSGYIAYIFHNEIGYSFWQYLPICAFVPIIFAPLINAIASRTPEPKETNSLIITFGITLIIETIYMAIFSADYRIIFHNQKFYAIHILNVSISSLQAYLIICSMGIIFLLYLLFKKTMIGKALRATMQNKEAAFLAGVPIEKMQFVAISMGCIACGIAGPLYARIAYLHPYGGLEPTIIALVITIFAGIGRIRPILVGAWLLALSETILSYVFSSQWKELLTSLILIAILMKNPEGGIFKRT